MARDTLQDLRAEAKRHGVSWREVRRLKDELVEQHTLRREATDGPRRRAWELFSHWNLTPGCVPFWRCGWSRIRQRVENAGRDYTAIRRYDMIAASVAEDYPEWSERDAGELFAMLFEDYVPWPPRRCFYERALGMAIEQPEAWYDEHPAPEF